MWTPVQALFFTTVFVGCQQSVASSWSSFDEGSVEFCMYEYPYTYSKCLHLCHESLDPACIADSLCLCDSSGKGEGNGKGDILHKGTRCKRTAYCDMACREKYFQGQFFKEGHFCARELTSSCICLF